MVEEDTSHRQLVDRLLAVGTIRSPEVEVAFRAVPRHAFLPEAVVAGAYDDNAVLTKHDRLGRPLSSTSQPTIVAAMLEALEIVPGQRVLEVGTGTGYNAALLAELAGPSGAVVTVELEPDLATAASRILARLGYGAVEVVVGDGAAGFEPRSPYDRIIVTAGARSLADAWAAQLVDGGRMVVPLVDAHNEGVVSLVEDTERGLETRGLHACRFLPLRAAGQS